MACVVQRTCEANTPLKKKTHMKEKMEHKEQETREGQAFEWIEAGKKAERNEKIEHEKGEEPTQEEQRRIYERVNRLRSTVNERLGKKGGEISPNSRTLYARRIKAAASHAPGFSGYLGYLDSVPARAFYPSRAALLWQLHTMAKARLADYNRRHRAGDWSGALEALKKAESAMKGADKLKQVEAPDGATKSLGNSSRRKIPAQSEWQTDMLEAATHAQISGIAVLILTGCRPAELEKGVSVTRTADSLIFTISGAKVTEDGGHEWRKVRHRIDMPPSPAIAAMLYILDEEGKGLVQRKAKRLGKDIEAINARMNASRAKRPTAYSFRHQLSADMKRAKLAPERIAAVLGHRVTRTQQIYGHAGQGKGGNGHPLATLTGTQASGTILNNTRSHPGARNPIARSALTGSESELALPVYPVCF